jgi:hypothetical protein
VKLRPTKLLHVTLLVAGLSATSAALALTPEEEATATKLMKDGIAAREKGDLAAAEKAFSAAHTLANLPSSGYALASVYEKQGKLLLALQVARGVTRLTPSKDWTSASVDGFKRSAELVTSLDRRVPSLVIEVPGYDDAALTIELDGARLSPPVLGVARKVDPGHHRATASAPGVAAQSLELDVAEREEKRVTFSLPPPKAGPRRADGAASSAPPPGSKPKSRDGGAGGPRPLLITGIVSLSVGVVGAGVGIVPALMAKGKIDDLEPHCPNDVCPPPYHDDLDSASSLALAANVAFIAGGVLAAAGLTLIVVDATSTPDDDPAVRAAVRVGPAWSGVDVRF